MISKIFRVVWFVSLAASLFILMYVYASLPDPMVIMKSEESVLISRNLWFYVTMGVLAVFNMFVFVIRALKKGQEEQGFVAWFYGQIITLNIFVIVATTFVSTYNSGERFDFSRIGSIIYGSIALMVLWALAWPVILLVRNIGKKQV